jgi:hypothetical protein
MQADFLLSSFLSMWLRAGGAGVTEEARSEWKLDDLCAYVLLL